MYCEGNGHKSCKLAQAKFAVGQGKHNLKMGFEWGHCKGYVRLKSWLLACDSFLKVDFLLCRQ